MGLIEVCEKQTEIIKILADIVDGLFMQLCQHLTVEEMDAMPELEKMQDVTRLQKSMEGGIVR